MFLFQNVLFPHQNATKPAFSNSFGLKSECFWKAPYSWRISVDGRPNRRNRVAFSNITGVVTWMGHKTGVIYVRRRTVLSAFISYFMELNCSQESFWHYLFIVGVVVFFYSELFEVWKTLWCFPSWECEVLRLSLSHCREEVKHSNRQTKKINIENTRRRLMRRCDFHSCCQISGILRMYILNADVYLTVRLENYY